MQIQCDLLPNIAGGGGISQRGPAGKPRCLPDATVTVNPPS